VSLTVREAYQRGPLAYFARLGKTLGHRWAAQQHRLEAFPDLAHQILEEMPAHQEVDPAELLEIVIATPGFVNQGSNDTFGDPPIPVFLDPRFHIEVLFWFSGTNSIHHHTFVGAFQVLTGSSVHSHYSFTERERPNSGFRLGDLRLESIERLERGNTRRILPTRDFIHSLFHLDHPSTTVVLRTHTQRQFLPALIYLKPHVALDAFYPDRSLHLRQRALKAAAKRDPARLEALMETAIEGTDRAARFILLQTYTTMTPDRARRAAFWERIRRSHVDVEELIPVFEEQARATRIHLARETVREPAHRYLLALLLNCPTKDDLLALTAAAFPAADARATVRGWLAELGSLVDDEMLGPMSGI